MKQLLPLLMLSACATGPRPVKVETVEIPVAVPVACVDENDIPDEPEKVGSKLTGNAAVDVGIVAISALELRKALKEARALLLGCVNPPPA